MPLKPPVLCQISISLPIQTGKCTKNQQNDLISPRILTKMVCNTMITKEEIKDPNNLNLWLKLNGEMMQNSSTSDFIFNVQYVVSHISQFMTLLPGDIISTGTPFGVGLGLKPPVYLKDGDVMELGIEGLGVSKQNVKAYM